METPQNSFGNSWSNYPAFTESKTKTIALSIITYLPTLALEILKCSRQTVCEPRSQLQPYTKEIETQKLKLKCCYCNESSPNYWLIIKLEKHVGLKKATVINYSGRVMMSEKTYIIFNLLRTLKHVHVQVYVTYIVTDINGPEINNMGNDWCHIE